MGRHKNPWWDENNNRIKGRKVRVYWNLRLKCWSILHKKLLVAHASSVSLKDVTFYVSEVRRQAVIRERKKNVHAYADGTLVSFNKKKFSGGFSIQISYNPYKYGYFYEVDTLKPIKSCARVWCGNKILYGQRTLKMI